MRYEKATIPYGGYWSSPFARWQGSFAHLHSLKFAADVTKQAMEQRKISPEILDTVVLGFTVPQKRTLYAGPWFSGLIGAPNATGPTLMQACATSARCLAQAAQEVDDGTAQTALVATFDRCSNGPHIYYPNPMGIGGMGDQEHWVFDSFGDDPWAKNSMIQTAENVANEAGITREEQDEVTLIRHAQYQQALADDRAFQKRYMVNVEVKDPSGRKVLKTLDADEGVFPTTKEGLQKLRPAIPEGTVTFGAQTYPADGNTGLLVTSEERAKEISTKPEIKIRIRSYGQARVKKGFMAQAVVPAARQAMERAGVKVSDLKAIKTHNPFAVNDIYLARELGVANDAMNDFGSSLIWGHPQGPTGARCVVELIEELVHKGGGYGLFAGCAAGDTSMGLVLEVST